MYATLMTVLLAAGAQPVCMDPQPLPAMVAVECESPECRPVEVLVVPDVGTKLVSTIKAWFGPMPQTCYAPRYGCYPGNDRYMNRYPAFHGYSQHEAYNYRTLFDYPWHAAPHEPQGYFACEVAGPMLEDVGPMMGEAIPMPEPEPATPPVAPLPLSLPAP